MKRTDEFSKKWAQIVAKAWSDPKFKQKLLSHPEETLREFGCKIPANMSVEIHQWPENEIHLSLPPKPPGNLSESDLKNIAAARGSCWTGMSW